MGSIIGPTPWWQANLVAECPEGTFLPDGSSIICKSGGTAWIVAPYCTQVNNTPWASGLYNSTQVGVKCSIVNDWPCLCQRLLDCGFNPFDWFVPSRSQLANPGSVCKDKWDVYTAGTTNNLWSSEDYSATNAYYNNGGLSSPNAPKSCCCVNGVRAFRCVTY
jgi:hypothetical protein